MQNPSLEQIRQDINFIHSTVEGIDSLTARINETRWKYELIKRNPALGVITHPGTGQTRTLTADEFRTNHDILVAERDTYVAVLTDMLGVSDMDTVREIYMRLIAAHQRYTQLRELHIMINAGNTAALEESAKQNMLTSEERVSAIEEARSNLMMLVADVPLRPISDLVTARILPSA